jgi:hypothetical protein
MCGGESIARISPSMDFVPRMSPFLVPLRFTGYGADRRPYLNRKGIVMKNIAAIALLVATTFAAVSAPAQDHQVKATVPFNFTVGDRTLPSGTYMISSNMTSPDLVAIRNWAKKTGALSLGQPNQSNPRHDNLLVFHKYGNKYYLSGIRSEGNSMNILFPTSNAEKRTRAEVEEAGLSVDEPVLIALK